MQISGMSSNFHQATNLFEAPQSKHRVDTDNRLSHDTEVTLSPEAMKEFEKLAMYTEQTAQYLAKVNVLNSSDAHKIGYGAWAEDFQSTYKSELTEYSSKFKASYEEVKIEHGILTSDDHYEKVIGLKGGNVKFQQAFEDKLSGDPRMLELMGILGIKKPA